MDRWDEGSWDKDPHRHGRFTAIEEQRENGLYKANEKDALFRIPQSSLFRTGYEDIHHLRPCFGRYIDCVKALKNLQFRA